MGFAEPMVEEDYQPLSIAEMTVWDDGIPSRRRATTTNAACCGTSLPTAERQLAELTPRDAQSLEKYRQVVGGAFNVIIGRKLPGQGEIEQEKLHELDRGSYLEFGSLLRNGQRHEAVPVVFLLPKQWSKQVVIWADERGKQVLFDRDGRPRQEVNKLLADGHAVVGIDLLGQGEFTADGQPWTQAPINHGGSGTAKWDTYAGYTFGYNHPLFSQRVHDLLGVVSFVRHYKWHSRARQHARFWAGRRLGGCGQGKPVRPSIASLWIPRLFDSPRSIRLTIPTICRAC